MALETLFAERFYQNKEQREAFHEDVSAKFNFFYEARLKQAEKIGPDTVARMRGRNKKSKEN